MFWEPARSSLSPFSSPQVSGDFGWAEGGRFARTDRPLSKSVRNAVLVWDLTNSTHPRRLAQLDGQVGSTSAMAFSADGNSLAAGLRRTAAVWDLADLNDLRRHATERACAVNGGLTRAEWARYVTDVPYERTCR